VIDAAGFLAQSLGVEPGLRYARVGSSQAQAQGQGSGAPRQSEARA